MFFENPEMELLKNPHQRVALKTHMMTFVCDNGFFGIIAKIRGSLFAISSLKVVDKKIMIGVVPK